MAIVIRPPKKAPGRKWKRRCFNSCSSCAAERNRVTKPDDSSLDPEDLRAVEERAHRLLDRANAWDRFPVPIDDILAAANVKLAPTSLFDPVAIIGYLKGKATDTGLRIKSAVAKVLGIYDAAESTIHIDDTVVKSKKNFLTLHETAHHDLPVHRKLFRLFQDCEKNLLPEMSDQFEREANNFARFALFKGDTYGRYAADCAFDIKTPITLAKNLALPIMLPRVNLSGPIIVPASSTFWSGSNLCRAQALRLPCAG
jgi:hypothetical protein